MGFIANALCEAAGEGDLDLLRMLVTAGGAVDSVGQVESPVESPVESCTVESCTVESYTS
jgi:hypothetical protein